MTIEQVKNFYDAKPFRSFVIDLLLVTDLEVRPPATGSAQLAER